ncbi:MAG: putative damage-inducible protein DinB [Nonlabens sp.]|jgi:uncharacterized damage-inducible protein DinB
MSKEININSLSQVLAHVNAIENILINDKSNYQDPIKKKVQNLKNNARSWLRQIEDMAPDEVIDTLDGMTKEYSQALIKMDSLKPLK